MNASGGACADDDPACRFKLDGRGQGTDVEIAVNKVAVGRAAVTLARSLEEGVPLGRGEGAVMTETVNSTSAAASSTRGASTSAAAPSTRGASASVATSSTRGTSVGAVTPYVPGSWARSSGTAGSGRYARTLVTRWMRSRTAWT